MCGKLENGCTGEKSRPENEVFHKFVGYCFTFVEYMVWCSWRKGNSDDNNESTKEV